MSHVTAIREAHILKTELDKRCLMISYYESLVVNEVYVRVLTSAGSVFKVHV